jgi:hypothetical protein
LPLLQVSSLFRGKQKHHVQRSWAYYDERQWLYYLLVFPRVIDNEIFEGSGQRVIPTRHNPVCLEARDRRNTFKTDLRSMHVYWDIAFKVDGTPMRQKRKSAFMKDEDIFKKKSKP